MKILFPASGNGDCIFCLADKKRWHLFLDNGGLSLFHR